MSNRGSFAVSALSLIALLGALTCCPVTASAQAFQPPTPEELKMTSEALAPGAPAIILYRQVDRDDNGRTSHEDNYLRIKILTEEGRKYADVEIPFFKASGDVIHIRARTIRPNGSAVDFDGKAFDKSIVKAKGVKYMAKTFTLPEVQIGSIIEYSYTLDLAEHYIYDSHWILSDELFTKKAVFSLKPFKSNYMPVYLHWTWQGLPPGSEVKQGGDGIIRMEASNIPAFQTEDFMPPPNELKSRVDFIYSEDSIEKDTNNYWKKVGKKRNDQLESFIGKHKAMEEAVAQIVSPTDSQETKLRKIYDRVQQIRNTSYEVQKTEQEEKRDKEKTLENVADIWKGGYGNGSQLTWLYLALVRAAGFDAYGVLVSSRSEYFFTPKTMQSEKLNANVVLVKLNGKDLYFDPGAAFTPFGLLTWYEAGTPGLRLDKDGGSWIMTTLPPSSDSRIDRNAKLKLSSDTGGLEGAVTITYTGLEAMYRRLDQRDSDAVARKTFLEDELKEQVPAAIEVDLTNKPDWSNSETPLVAEFSLKVPGWLSGAGKRAVMPVGLFTANEKRIFEHANRTQPIYFEYPFEKLDDVSIELPTGWQVASLPPAKKEDGHIVSYTLNVENNHETLHLTRKLNVDFLFLETKYYGALRTFFQVVRTGDEEQIVLQPGAATARN
jgi:Domain of Unknown Function with PDB structure (DUF3857)